MANKDIYDSRSYKKIFLPGQFCQVIDKCVGEYRIEMAQSPFQGKRVVVGGTFNGIVLLALKNPKSRFLKVDDIMLYNPLTRMYNQVPDPPPLVASSIRKYTVSALGFGHGATQDDLKIVTLGGAVVYNNNNNAQSRMEKVRCRHPLSSYSFDWNNDARFWAVGRRPLPSDLFYQDNDAQSRMEGPELSRPLYWNVFSLKNKSWSKLTAEPQLHYSEFSTYAGTFVNGFLYWIITRRKRSFHPFGAVLISSKKLILALDVKKMIFSEIEVVDDIAFDVLGTINGRLCWVTCNKTAYNPDED